MGDEANVRPVTNVDVHGRGEALGTLGVDNLDGAGIED
jgi:hypothetical protein